MNHHCPLICTPAMGDEATKKIIGAVCCDNNSSTSEIMSGSRFGSIVKARHLSIRAVASAKPWLSSSQLGIIFGMNHSSILFALGRLKRKPAWSVI